MNTPRLYLRYWGISIRSQMQYRGSFLMLAWGNLVLTAMEFAGVWMLFDRFGSIQGWTLPQVALLYGMVHVAFAIAESALRGFDIFDRLIRSGNFDRLLLRPRSAALQVAAQELQLMRIGRFSQGLCVLLWGAWKLGITWDPPRIALLIAAILGGACVFGGLFILQATLAFWTVEPAEIVNTVTYGGVETAQFPLSVYGPRFRWFFTFVIPLASINYLPVHAICRRVDVLGSPVWAQWLSPLAGAAFLLVCLQVWRFGVSRYCSTGS